MDPTESKAPGWYPSSKTPGMERYWNGDYWTSEYRPASGPLEAKPASPKPEANDSDVWSKLEESAGSSEPVFAPGVQTEYTQASANPGSYAPYAPAYPNYGYPQPQTKPQSPLGIVALILAFFIPLAGAIVGHVSLSKAKREGYGTGTSLAAIIIGWVFTALSLLIVIPFFLAFGTIFNSGYTSSDDYGYDDYSYESDSNIVPTYTLSVLAEDKLNSLYPDYTWYVSCDESLEFSAQASTQCDSTVYFYEETNESQDIPLTVTLTGEGDSYNPEITVQLSEEPVAPPSGTVPSL